MLQDEGGIASSIDNTAMVGETTSKTASHMRMLAPSHLPPLPPLTTLEDLEETVNDTNDEDTKATFSSLPPELLLEVIPRVPYSPSNLSALRRTSPELKSLIHRHETSIVRAINELQHHCSPSQAHQSHHLFPSLQLHNFASLDVLHGRLVRLEDLHAQWLHITSHGPELAWLRGRWETIHKAGLLLLYRLQDVNREAPKSTTPSSPPSLPSSPQSSGDNNDPSSSSPAIYTPHYPSPAAIALLETLPAPALACLLFKLVSSIKILRVHGAAPIHGTYAAGDVLTRSDVELAAEEMLLLHGPEWFLGMMRAGRGGRKGKNGEGEEERSGRRGKEEDDGQWAVDLLTSELTNFTTRQSPDPTTHLPRPPTLTSRLRRAFSNQTGNSPLVENLGRMWEMLAAPVWDRVDEEMLGRVVGGVGLLGRRRTAGGGGRGGEDEEGKKKKVGGLARRGAGGGRERMGSGDGDDLKGRGRCGSAASASSSASCSSSSSSSSTSRSRSST